MPSSVLRRPLWRRALPPSCILLALVLLTGCFTFETTVTVRRDGSGTVEQVFSLTGPMIEMMRMFSGEDEGLDLCKEEDLEAQAADLGEGVRLVSAELIEEDERIGCRARYAFDDVNTLKIDQNPGGQMPSQMTATQETTPPEEFVTFGFDPGSPAMLTVRLPQNFDEEKPEEAEDPFAPDSTQKLQQLQMVREMLKGGRIHLSVAVEGAITGTDATYRDGPRVTLMEIDFDELLKDEAQLERLMDADPKSVEEVKALLDAVSGIKIETQEEVEIRFD